MAKTRHGSEGLHTPIHPPHYTCRVHDYRDWVAETHQFYQQINMQHYNENFIELGCSVLIGEYWSLQFFCKIVDCARILYQKRHHCQVYNEIANLKNRGDERCH